MVAPTSLARLLEQMFITNDLSTVWKVRSHTVAHMSRVAVAQNLHHGEALIGGC